MITSPSLRIYASTEESSSNDGGGEDNGSGGGSSDSGGGSEDKQESKSSDSGDSNDGAESKDDGSSEDSKQDSGTKDVEEDTKTDDLKGTAEEQEKAAIEDYIYDEPGYVKPYPFVPKDKPIDKQPFNCKDNKWYKGCAPIHPNPIKHIENCKNKGDWNHNCKVHHPWKGKCDHWWSNWQCHHGKHPHHGGNDNHNHRDSKHTHTSTSGGHGDLDLIINIDHYNTKSASKLKDFNLQIDVIQQDDSDNVYDKNLDLSKMPDKIKIEHLDIDKGDLFLTQLVNNDAEDGDSYLAVADEDPVSIYITAE